jgi:hypothetical protein
MEIFFNLQEQCLQMQGLSRQEENKLKVFIKVLQIMFGRKRWEVREGRRNLMHLPNKITTVESRHTKRGMQHAL